MLYDKRWERKTDAVGELLLRAADLLERKGWCQGKFRIGDAHCALNAISEASDGDEMLAEQAVVRMDAFLGALAPTEFSVKGSSLVTWNDSKGRTQQEVIAGFRLGAMQLEI